MNIAGAPPSAALLLTLLITSTIAVPASAPAPTTAGCPTDLRSLLLKNQPAANDAPQTLQRKLSELMNLTSEIYMRGSSPDCAASAQRMIGQIYERNGDREEASRRFKWADEIATLSGPGRSQPVTAVSTKSQSASGTSTPPVAANKTTGAKATGAKPPKVRTAGTVIYFGHPWQGTTKFWVGTGANLAQARRNLHQQKNYDFDLNGTPIGGDAGRTRDLDKLECDSSGWWVVVVGSPSKGPRRDSVGVACGAGPSRDPVLRAALEKFQAAGGEVHEGTSFYWGFNDGSSRESPAESSNINAGFYCIWSPGDPEVKRFIPFEGDCGDVPL